MFKTLMKYILIMLFSFSIVFGVVGQDFDKMADQVGYDQESDYDETNVCVTCASKELQHSSTSAKGNVQDNSSGAVDSDSGSSGMSF